MCSKAAIELSSNFLNKSSKLVPASVLSSGDIEILKCLVPEINVSGSCLRSFSERKSITFLNP